MFLLCHKWDIDNTCDNIVTKLAEFEPVLHAPMALYMQDWDFSVSGVQLGKANKTSNKTLVVSACTHC